MATPFLRFSESGALGGHSPEDQGALLFPASGMLAFLSLHPRNVQHNLPLCVGFDRKRPFQGTFSFGSNTMVSQGKKS